MRKIAVVIQAWWWLGTALCGGIASAQTDLPGVTAPLGQSFKVPQILVKEQARLVMYRLATDKTPNVASVYVNGAYQASLQRGAFTELCMPPITAEVSAKMVQNMVPVTGDMDVTNALVLKGGEDLFVRVSEQANGRAVLMSVRPAQALPELVKLRAQQHTVSRVPTAVVCQDGPSKSITPVTPKEQSTKVQTITLEADALFDFGKSDVKAIPAKGQRILGHLVDRIKSEFGRGDRVRIQIVGYADSFGSEATNMRLSKERAAAIKSYFVQGGLSATSIKTDGRGDKARVITTCGTKLTQENVACNKPNRRVVVTVSGTPSIETKE